MEHIFYYIYCAGILGVKTNAADFRWIYGSAAPEASLEDYEKCVLKFDVCVVPEKHLTQPLACDRRFQVFTWCDKTHTISFRRRFLRHIQTGYNICVSGNTVSAEIGRNYFKFIRLRMMNLHGVYYLLSDLANMLLLKNGFLTLYASSAYYAPTGKTVVCFAPPNTGKTITALKLCDTYGYALVGEDVVITDGHRIYSCPWTCSYRKGNSRVDQAGSFGRATRIPKQAFCDVCDLTNMAVLSLGPKDISMEKHRIASRVCTLNGYLFYYYASPIIKILGYFDPEYCEPWEAKAKAMLEDMVQQAECRFLQSEQPTDFYEMIQLEMEENG